jgi:hypothetical protein
MSCLYKLQNRRQTQFASTIALGATAAALASSNHSVTAALAAVTAADWTIVIHPSLIITNTLPCTVEIQLTQPVPQPVSTSTAAAASDAAATGTTQHDVTAATAAAQQQPVQRKQRARDPGLDLFFLPETMQPASSSSSVHHVNGSGSSNSVSGSNIGNSSSNTGGINSSSRTARAAAAAAASAQAAAVLQEWDVKQQQQQQDQQKQHCSTIRVVWQCVLETGKEGTAGALTAGQPLWLRMRVAAGGGGAVWSQPLVITAAAVASR